MKTLTCRLTLLALAASALPLAAQTTTTPKPVVHHTTATATAAHSTVVHAPACAVLPALSDNIPALPTGTPCAKPLYTLTKTPDTKVDYASPLLSEAVKESLGAAATTYSLYYTDVTPGTGDLVVAGKFLSVKYTGYLVDGTKFDSSVDRGDPISFPYGKHRVIQGWDTGFEGMHIGGKRRLFIPYQLGYGEAGRPPVIPAKAELIFDVEFIAQGDEAPKPKAPPAPVRTPGAAPAGAPPTGAAGAAPAGQSAR